MDRFDSREEVSFRPEPFNRGAKARRAGKSLASNPYVLLLTWDSKSWQAGWCDEDQGIQSQKEG
jgi:hypothetical protein